MKDLFLKYVDVQMDGSYNMITDASIVMQIIGASKEDYLYIIQNYSQLKEQYKSDYEKVIEKYL